MRTEMRMANQKQIEADQWRLVFQTAVRRYRGWVVLWFGRRRLYARMVELGLPPGRLYHLEKLIEQAHDMALHAHEMAIASVCSASSSEMAARIYFEEVEGREHARLRQQETDDEVV